MVGMSEAGPVLLGDVADVSLGAAAPKSISRTNGKPSVGVSIVKEAEANTIDVTNAVREALDGLTGLPSDVEIVIVSDQGLAFSTRSTRYEGGDVWVPVRGYGRIRVHADAEANGTARAAQHPSSDRRHSPVDPR